MIGTISNDSGKRSNLSSYFILKNNKFTTVTLKPWLAYLRFSWIYYSTNFSGLNELALLFSLLSLRKLVLLINILLVGEKVGENITFFHFDLTFPSVPVHSGLTLSDSLSVFNRSQRPIYTVKISFYDYYVVFLERLRLFIRNH